MNYYSRACVVCLVLSGCMVGPDYKRPDAPASPAFKELSGWKPSLPSDAMEKGAWWSVYHDPELDRLERTVDVSNQTVKSFEAQYRNAVALVAEARSGLFPVVSVSSGVTRSGGGGSSGGSGFNSSSLGTGGSSSFGGGPRTQYSLTGNVTWDLDVWGRIRRQVESNVAGAQVSAADLANATLSAQATLATDYFDLRAEDALSKLLADTVTAYKRALEITQNQYHAGTTSSIDYVTALALLQSTQAQLIAVGVQRQQFEHAIAVLTGQPPANLTLPPAPLATDVPVVPAGLPSALLERRPDIAAAERAMQQENALIGVEVAAFYPDISLSALGGFAGNPLGQLFNSSNQLWSLAASGTETLFEGGLRSASVAAARATYEFIRGDLPADRVDCVPASGGSAVEPAYPRTAGQGSSHRGGLQQPSGKGYAECLRCRNGPLYQRCHRADVAAVQRADRAGSAAEPAGGKRGVDRGAGRRLVDR